MALNEKTERRDTNEEHAMDYQRGNDLGIFSMAASEIDQLIAVEYTKKGDIGGRGSVQKCADPFLFKEENHEVSL